MWSPVLSAKKNSYCTAPRNVGGRFNDRKTGLVCIVIASGGLNPEQPSEEIHGQDGHPQTEDDACEGFLSSAFAEGERQATYNDGDYRKTFGHGTREGRLHNADSI